jgi:hypothetical protein
LTRGFPRLARSIIPTLLALSLLAACRSGSATPTATTSTTTPSASSSTSSARRGSPTLSATRAAAATPTLVIPNTPTPATPVVVTQTDVVVIKPVNAGGLVATYHRSDSVVGNCLGPSLVTTARADAWRCAINASGEILDPCFASSKEPQPALFCFRQPWVSNVSLMVLSSPLPDGRPDSSDPTVVQPWGFELADGTRCTMVTETMALIANLRVNATCPDGGKAIGDVDRSQPQRIQIVRAWY